MNPKRTDINRPRRAPDTRRLSRWAASLGPIILLSVVCPGLSAIGSDTPANNVGTSTSTDTPVNASAQTPARASAAKPQPSGQVNRPERVFTPGERFLVHARSWFQQVHTYNETAKSGQAREEASLVAVELIGLLDVTEVNSKTGRVSAGRLQVRSLTRAVVAQDPVDLLGAGATFDIALSPAGELTLTPVAETQTEGKPSTSPATLSVAAAQALSQTLRYFTVEPEPWLVGTGDLKKPNDSVPVDPELFLKPIDAVGRFTIKPADIEGTIKLLKRQPSSVGEENVVSAQVRVKAYRDSLAPDHLTVRNATMTTSVELTLPVDPTRGRVLKKTVTRSTMQVEPEPAQPQPGYHQFELATPTLEPAGASQSLERVEVNQIELTPVRAPG